MSLSWDTQLRHTFDSNAYPSVNPMTLKMPVVEEALTTLIKFNFEMLVHVQFIAEYCPYEGMLC